MLNETFLMIFGDLIFMIFGDIFPEMVSEISSKITKNHEVRSPKIMKNVSFHMLMFGN